VWILNFAPWPGGLVARLIPPDPLAGRYLTNLPNPFSALVYTASPVTLPVLAGSVPVAGGQRFPYGRVVDPD